MPTNNFKLFDQNKANLLSDTEYANATQRLNGVQTGVASSQLNNKFAYQVSLVAYSIAQIMNQNGLDASDTLAVSAFVGNLGGSLLQKVADRASSAEAAAGVLANKYISPATMKAAALLLSGGTMTGPIAMGNNKITGLATPTATSDAATKGYVDGRSKVLSESVTINENFTGSTPTISKALTHDIDLNKVDAIGIRMTFNENYVLKNTSSNSSYGLTISYRGATLFRVVVNTNEEYTIANYGQSIFIPILLYPQIYKDSYEKSYGGIAESIGAFTLPSLKLIYSDKTIISDRIDLNANNDIKISVDRPKYNTTIGQNITFNIYKIYF